MAAGRHAQPPEDPAPQGQVRQQIQCLVRDRVLRAPRLDGRRGGQGIRTIIEMAHVTRLDFAIGSSGLMRQALSRPSITPRNRRAFQRALVDLPIMQNVVADLAVETEALMWLSMRLASALDRSRDDRARGAAVAHLHAGGEILGLQARACSSSPKRSECHGGNGFIADHLMERLYREAPLNGIWEGTGNVICLDVLRAMQREPETSDGLPRRSPPGAGRRPARSMPSPTSSSAAWSKAGELEPVARRGRRDDGLRAAGKPAGAVLVACGRGRLLHDAARRRLGPGVRHHAQGHRRAQDYRPGPRSCFVTGRTLGSPALNPWAGTLPIIDLVGLGLLFENPASTLPDHALHTRATLNLISACGEVAERLKAPHSKFGYGRICG